MELRRVVVTGLGAITPIGDNVEEYWKSLVKGVSGSDIITRFDAAKFKTKFACEVKNYDPLNYFDRKEARTYINYRFSYGATATITMPITEGIELKRVDELIRGHFLAYKFDDTIFDLEIPSNARFV